MLFSLEKLSFIGFQLRIAPQVAWTCPEAVSLHLEHFIGPWCAALRHLQDGIEKEHAFLGLCDVVRLNPQASPLPPQNHACNTEPSHALGERPPGALCFRLTG